jgi:hypothetical protein
MRRPFCIGLRPPVALRMSRARLRRFTFVVGAIVIVTFAIRTPVDAHGRVDGWETPPLHAECD